MSTFGKLVLLESAVVSTSLPNVLEGVKFTNVKICSISENFISVENNDLDITDVIESIKILLQYTMKHYRWYNKYMQNDTSISLYVFIDASNLWAAQKAKGYMFDYEKLKKYLKETHSADTIKIFYYTAYPANGTRDYSLDSKHNFFTYLKKGLDFEVRKKELKRIHKKTEDGDVVEEKGNMDVEMSIDVVHYKAKYNVAVFFSGDSDFLALVNYLKNDGKKVYVYSSKNNVSEEMRTGSNGYTEVLEIKEDIWGRKLVHKK